MLLGGNADHELARVVAVDDRYRWVFPRLLQLKQKLADEPLCACKSFRRSRVKPRERGPFGNSGHELPVSWAEMNAIGVVVVPIFHL